MVFQGNRAQGCMGHMIIVFCYLVTGDQLWAKTADFCYHIYAMLEKETFNAI